MHVAAVQFPDPSVTIAYDVNPAEATHTRALVFADAAKNAYLIGGAHISFPGLGPIPSNDWATTYVKGGTHPLFFLSIHRVRPHVNA